MEQLKLTVSGMMCEHCKMRVNNAILNVSGVKEVNVSLKDGTVEVKGESLDETKIKAAITSAGY